MTIYSDNAGNKFLGDCIWANHNISYPTINFLQAHPHSSISAELNQLGTESFGSKLYYVEPQNHLNDFAQTVARVLIGWTPINDNQCANARFLIGYRENQSIWNANEGAYSGYVRLGMFNDTGFNQSYDSLPSTINNRLINIRRNHLNIQISNDTTTNMEGFLPSSFDKSEIIWAGVSDGNSLALFKYQYDFVTNRIRFAFNYQGLLADINTNSNYYNATIANQCVMFLGASTGIAGRYPSNGTVEQSLLAGGHFIANTHKQLLTTGDARYPIVCADGKTPSSQWATDFYVFDNNATLGYPAIGRVRNLLLAQGTYTIGKPVKIQGAVSPDNGFNAWLPVGTFAGKTVLMRCYSSVLV